LSPFYQATIEPEQAIFFRAAGIKTDGCQKKAQSRVQNESHQLTEPPLASMPDSTFGILIRPIY
jgi:hypothetical protein